MLIPFLIRTVKLIYAIILGGPIGEDDQGECSEEW